MARPFDDSSQYMGSSASSQTSLAANRAWTASTDAAYPPSTIYGEGGSIWKYKSTPKPNPAGAGTRLAKIKSSPSNGALAAARSSAGHGRLHKRGTSASASQSPVSSTFDTSFEFQDLMTPPSVYSDQASPPVVGKSRVKIKPLLRKFSSDTNSIDLSRSAAENVGLGLYGASDFTGEVKTSADISVKRGYHHRSNSQVSTTTTASTHRHGAQYIHPFRQTPRPYTPPIETAYHTSSPVNEALTDGPVSAASEPPDLDSYHHQTVNPTAYAPLPSSRRMPPPLHIRTHSSSRLTSSSQTNLPGTPSSLRQHSDIKPPDTMLPSGRSSLDTLFRKRSRANTATDPQAEAAAQAATVAHLRQQFDEKERAKDLKYREAEARAQAKEEAKRQKREASETRKSEAKERKRAKSNAASEKAAPMAECDAANSRAYHAPPIQGAAKQRRRGATGASAGKAVHSRWQLFWFRFKTAWLRLKRKMSKK
ncbi:MAG: hypothetical protein Q9191_004287 [Dirinaria sp. TL-2023a]